MNKTINSAKIQDAKFWRLVLSALIALIALTSTARADDAEELIYLSVQSMPKNIYKNQIIKVGYKAIIVDSFDKISTGFFGQEGVEILNDNPVWKSSEANVYGTTVYMRVLENAFKMPDLQVTITKTSGQIHQSTLRGKHLKALSISSNKKYIGVISNSITVQEHTVQRFNDTHNIITLALSGYLANFKDMNIAVAQKQGYDALQATYPISQIYYYAVIPNDITTFSFLTFDPDLGNFVNHDIKLNFSDFGQKISTQIDLNPNKRKFPFLETAILGFLTLTAMFFLIKTRHWSFFLLLSLIIGFGSWYLLKEDDVIIAPGSNVYLLPIKNSTLFYTAEVALQAKKLRQNDKYVKVLLPDGNVGWVNKENVR